MVSGRSSTVPAVTCCRGLSVRISIRVANDPNRLSFAFAIDKDHRNKPVRLPNSLKGLGLLHAASRVSSAEQRSFAA